jgi:hypothetical protein
MIQIINCTQKLHVINMVHRILNEEWIIAKDLYSCNIDMISVSPRSCWVPAIKGEMQVAGAVAPNTNTPS